MPAWIDLNKNWLQTEVGSSKEEIIGDNAASAMLNVLIREKYFKF